MIDANEQGFCELEDAVELYFQHVSAGGEAHDDRLLEEHADLRHLLEPLLADAGRAAPTEVGMSPPSKAGSFAPGKRIGCYRIVREIGRGAMGVVFEAIQEPLGRRVALKVMSGANLANDEYLSPSARFRFLREAVTAAKVDNSGICRVYEASTTDDLPFIAMEYVEGLTLTEILARAADEETDETLTDLFMDLESLGEKAPEPGEAETPRERKTTTQSRSRAELDSVVRLIESVARSIHEAHEAGVVHRDLKPSNIMVRKNGEPVILDFGLAFDSLDDRVGHLTEQGARLGTPCYMSPEQVEGRIDALDKRSDIFSLGVILYQLLTLERPFASKTREGLYRRILQAQPQDPRRHNRHISPDLNAVCLKALERRRGRRYQTAREFADDLARVCDHETTVARPLSVFGRTWRFTLRRRWQVAAAALLVTVTGAFYMYGGKTGELRDAASVVVATWNVAEAYERGEDPDAKDLKTLRDHLGIEAVARTRGDPRALRFLVKEELSTLRAGSSWQFASPRGILVGRDLVFRFKPGVDKDCDFRLTIIDEETYEEVEHYTLPGDARDQNGFITFELAESSKVSVTEPGPTRYLWKVAPVAKIATNRKPRFGSSPLPTLFGLLSPAFVKRALDRVKPTGDPDTNRLLRAMVLLHHGLAVEVLRELEGLSDQATENVKRLADLLRNNARTIL